MIRQSNGFIRSSRRPPRLSSSVLAFIGKLLLAMSLGVLLGLAWILWGTKAAAERGQQALAAEYAEQPTFYKVPAGDEPEHLLPPTDFAPAAGKPLFRLRIPKMDLDDVVVEGVEPEQLDVAPGHYPTCRKNVSSKLCTPWEAPFPGEPGRAIISGHRTTHGAQFWDLNVLKPGDRIFTETRWGDFVYEVERQRIVPAESKQIVIPTRRPELVLTTCHPRFSADQRLVVIATLAEAEPPA